MRTVAIGAGVLVVLVLSVYAVCLRIEQWMLRLRWARMVEEVQRRRSDRTQEIRRVRR